MEQLCTPVTKDELLQTLRKSAIPTLDLKYKRPTSRLEQPKITDAQAAYHYLMKTWDIDKIDLCEQFKVLLLDRSSRPIGVCLISQGDSRSTVVSPSFVFGLAILANAESIIVAHNHPSGTLEPSKADEVLTKRLAEAAEFLQIRFLDHLIVTRESFLSLASQGLL